MDTPGQDDLESFRQQWREEVAAKTRPSTAPRSPRPKPNGPGRPAKNLPPPKSSVQIVKDNEDASDWSGRTYHDLEDKEEGLKLGNDGTASREGLKDREPRSALDHYEKAVERETQGKLGDSVSLYRKAFKLDSKVHESYKAKHFPPSSVISKPQNPNPSNASVTVPNPAHHSLEGPKQDNPTQQPQEVQKRDIRALIEEFASLSIPGAPPETDLSEAPPCPIADLPHEILVEILMTLANKDVASLGRLARVCKAFAYLVMTEDSLWKRITLGTIVGFASMHYTYACDVQGRPVVGMVLDDEMLVRPKFQDLTPTVWPTYRGQFRHRPRIRFNGCYISTVNYTRAGMSTQSRFTWIDPVQIVTYYRYLRFFRDGSVISLLTTSEPIDVVHHLVKDNLHKHHSGGLPQAVMKDALSGRWRLSGATPKQSELQEQEDLLRGPGEYSKEPLSGADEEEGDVHVETEGVVPKYMWKMQFALASAGRKDGTRNGKLNWKGFWSYNRLTDDWGEFGLKNDRAFYYSRVKSYEK